MEEIEKMSMEEYAAYRAKQDGFPRKLKGVIKYAQRFSDPYFIIAVRR